MKSQSLVNISLVASCSLPNRHGTFRMHGFQDRSTGLEHVALSMGNIADGAPVLARLHSECMTGDALFSQRCDCGAQLDAALGRIAAAGRGVLLYLRQEGRGIGLLNKIRAYALQDDGADTVEANELLGFKADQREFSMCQPMLAQLGVRAVNLMTNNPKKVSALRDAGVTVVQRVPLREGRNPHNAFYLDTKVARLGHILHDSSDDGVRLLGTA